MKFQKHRTILSGGSRIALGFALLASGSAALAQAAPSPAPAPTPAAGEAQTSQGEEIVVTAQFREQNLQTTPLAITAVSGAMMEARSQTNISQVAAQAPSVTLKPQGAAFGPSLGAYIRGVGQFDFNPALEPGVGVYVDDVYYATLTGSIFDLLDLDRVEILRGPQGTLAGRNSIGGAIKLYSKLPTGSNSGFVEGAYGSRNRIDLRGGFDAKLTDSLFFRLSAVAKKQDGYVKRLDFGCVNPPGSPNNPSSATQTPIPQIVPANADCLVARDGEVDYNAVRGVLRYQPSDTLDIVLIGDYTHDDRNVAGSVLLDRSVNGVRVQPQFQQPGARHRSLYAQHRTGIAAHSARHALPVRKIRNYASFMSLADGTLPLEVANGRTDYKGYGFSGQINWQVADKIQLVSISAYRHYLTIFSNDDDVSPLAHSFGRGNLSFHSFSQELRLNGSFGDNDQVEYTLGGFYMDQKSVYATLQDLRYAGLPPFAGDDPVNADSKAAFLHVQWKPIDALTLTGGIRYTDEHKDYTLFAQDAIGRRAWATTGAARRQDRHLQRQSARLPRRRPI